LLLIVSHAPGRLLPTIRSRCRRLALRALEPADVAHAVAAALGRDAGEGEIKAAALAADGSVARALDLVSGSGLAIREKVNAMLSALPDVNPRELHALGDALGRGDAAFTAFVDAVRDWLSARVIVKGAEPSRLIRMADAWDRLNRAAREVETYNLERKPMVFNVFGWLAEAARG
jgi:DNA polymerase-3 subunit delta'